MIEKNGMNTLLNFWKKNYLQEYIPAGGSKIKFVTGRKGSGKTYFLNSFLQEGKKEGYITAHFSAYKVWLKDFREIYFEILRQVNIENLLQDCADEIISRMGDDPEELPEGRTYIDWLASRGKANVFNKRQIRDELQEMFLNNPHLDNNFAIACGLLTAGILGYPALDEESRNIYLGWLNGDKTLKAQTLRTAGMLPGKITNYNARHMLRSLAEVIHMGKHPGLLVSIDDFDILQEQKGMYDIHYAKVGRESAYESIRELIDDIDTLHYVMFVYGFDRALIDNEKYGLKSYQALWMRVQNEVVSNRFNCFTDIADLDQLAQQMYTPEYLVAMSRNFALSARTSARPLNEEDAENILKQAEFGTTGIADLIKERTLKGDDPNE